MGDDQHRGLCGQFEDDIAQCLFVDRVELRGHLVEEEQARAAQQGAGDGDALAFAAGEGDAPVADRRVQALGQPGDQGVQAGAGDRLRQPLLGGVGGREEQVLAEGARQDRGVLFHVRERAAQLREGQSLMSRPSSAMVPVSWS